MTNFLYKTDVYSSKFSTTHLHAGHYAGCPLIEELFKTYSDVSMFTSGRAVISGSDSSGWLTHFSSQPELIAVQRQPGMHGSHSATLSSATAAASGDMHTSMIAHSNASWRSSSITFTFPWRFIDAFEQCFRTLAGRLRTNAWHVVTDAWCMVWSV